MENTTKIISAGGIIDFYINKIKYEKLKTKRGKFNYVYTELNKYLISLKGLKINGVEIRDVSITSNHFWGIDEFCFINDLNYCVSNLVPLKEDVLTIRIFHIDLLGVIIEEKEFHEYFLHGKLELTDEKFHIEISNLKIV